MTIAHKTIAANFAELRERMARAAERAGRKAEEITFVAVSKTLPASAIREAWAAGVRHFGENRVQEWEEKRRDLADLSATWHLVGHLQGNKARRAIAFFHAIDSLDTLDLARRLSAVLETESAAARAAGVEVRRLRVLLEVRLAPEESKTGAEPDALEPLIRGVLDLPHLDLRGLMCIPPYSENPEEARPHFRRLRELRDSLQVALASHTAAQAAAARGEVFLPVLSMGMSHDFEVAIEEGATEVRIGTALFGPRT
jgi:pyridoxal phosphate enzyme (YggS family)